MKQNRQNTQIKLHEYSLNESTTFNKSISKGWLFKWKIGDTWIKSPGYFYNFMYESYAEILVSAIAKDLGIKNCLTYRPCIININNERVLGCESKDYTYGMQEITLQKLSDLGITDNFEHCGYSGYKSLLKQLKEVFGIHLQNYLENMILLDSIILNNDRNLWNISLLIDSNNRAYECKIYDSGNSLGLSTFREGHFTEELLYMEGFEAKPFDSSYEAQVNYIRKNRVFNNTLENTRNMLKFIEYNFCLNNTYNVSNTLTPGQMQYTKELIQARHKSIMTLLQNK